MSISMTEKELVDASLIKFCDNYKNLLHSRHLSELNDEARIRDVAKQAMDMECVDFMRKLSESTTITMDRRGVLVGQFCHLYQSLMDKYVALNQDVKEKWESFLQTRIDSISEDLRVSWEVKLLSNSDMSVQSFEGLLDSEKLAAMSYFLQMWKLEKLYACEEQMRKLEQKLDDLKKEILEKKKARNPSGDGRRLDPENDAEGEGSNRNLKQEIEAILDRLKHVAGYLNGKHGNMHMQVLGHLENAIKCLDDMPLEDATQSTFELDLHHGSLFIEIENAERQKNVFVEKPKTDTNPGVPNTSACKMLSFEESVTDEPSELVERSVMNGVRKPEAFTSEILSDSRMTAENNPIVLARGDHQNIMKGPSAILPAPASATEEFVPVSSQIEPAPSWSSLNRLNPYEGEGFDPLLRAIWNGESVESIQKILDTGTNVNAKTSNGAWSNCNAVHMVMISLIDKKLTSSSVAIAILNLLVAKGFNLINQQNARGYPPIFLAMDWKSLDEDLLRWFYENGADFNAVDDYGNSVLLAAIFHGQNVDMIRKILEFGADPKRVNRNGDGVLHKAAYGANDGALEFFIDHHHHQFDVNGVNHENSTPMFMLFMWWKMLLPRRNYQRSLEILLENGAHLCGSCKKGCPNALVHWLKHGGSNPFPALVKVKDRLPITDEIASTALTAIVEEIEDIQKYLIMGTSRLDQLAFAEFTVFLIEEKNAKLRLQCKGKWIKLRKLRRLEKKILTADFTEELKRDEEWNWIGSLVRIQNASIEMFEFNTSCGGCIISFPVSTEAVLGCLLACGAYHGFIDVCLSLLNAVQKYRDGRRGKRSMCVVQ